MQSILDYNFRQITLITWCYGCCRATMDTNLAERESFILWPKTSYSNEFRNLINIELPR